MKTALTVLVALVATTACEQVPQTPEEQSVLEPREYVMPTEYNWGDPAPALEAWRYVTTKRGWTQENILAWEPFVTEVMRTESGFCPNVRRGAILADPIGCVIKTQGLHSDSGFGQVLGGYPNRKGWVYGGTSWKLNEHASWMCAQEGLCTPDEIIANPEASMTALVALIERGGNSGWCYTPKLRKSHRCRIAP